MNFPQLFVNRRIQNNEKKLKANESETPVNNLIKLYEYQFRKGNESVIKRLGELYEKKADMLPSNDKPTFYALKARLMEENGYSSKAFGFYVNAICESMTHIPPNGQRYLTVARRINPVHPDLETLSYELAAKHENYANHLLINASMNNLNNYFDAIQFLKHAAEIIAPYSINDQRKYLEAAQSINNELNLSNHHFSTDQQKRIHEEGEIVKGQLSLIYDKILKRTRPNMVP